MLSILGKINLTLFVLVAACLPVFKVAELWRKMPLPPDPVRNPSLEEMRHLGVQEAAEWGYTDQLGYGLLRRFDDSGYWLLIGLLLANRSVLQIFPLCDIPLPKRQAISAGIVVGLAFGAGYLFAVSVEGGTFFSGRKELSGIRYWALQVPEGALNVTVMFISGVCVVLYFNAIAQLGKRSSAPVDALAKLNAIGYTPLLIVTLFTAAVGFIGIRFETADRTTLVVVQLVVLTGSYLAGLIYAKWQIPMA